MLFTYINKDAQTIVKGSEIMILAAVYSAALVRCF